MKIFHVILTSTQNVEDTDDFTEAFICKAESEEEARKIVPFGLYKNWGKPEDVHVTYLGEYKGNENFQPYIWDKRILMSKAYKW